MLNILLIRHGECDWNKEHRFLGRTDHPLNRRGISQAKHVASKLEKLPLSVILSSPARRALETARFIAEASNAPLSVVTELEEIDFGSWEGLTKDQVIQKYPSQWAAWLSDPLTGAPHHGETLMQVSERARTVFRRTAGDFATQERAVIAVVGHAGSLQVLIATLLGTPLRAVWPYLLAPGSVTQLVVTGEEVVLASLSDTSRQRTRLVNPF